MHADRFGAMAAATIRFPLGSELRRSSSGGACMSDIIEIVEQENVFDPDTIRLMASALEEAWDRIERSGSRFARPGYSRAMREVIARFIIEMAQQGVTDPQTLAERTVSYMTANYKDPRDPH
jgi:hypothetical protein